MCISVYTFATNKMECNASVKSVCMYVWTYLIFIHKCTVFMEVEWGGVDMRWYWDRLGSDDPVWILHQSRRVTPTRYLDTWPCQYTIYCTYKYIRTYLRLYISTFIPSFWYVILRPPPVPHLLSHKHYLFVTSWNKFGIWYSIQYERREVWLISYKRSVCSNSKEFKTLNL